MLRGVAIALFFASACFVGCGDATTVSGKVTLDGSPLPNAQITFHGPGGMALSGSDAGGNFTLQPADEKGIATGEYKITVVATELKDPAAAAAAASGAHVAEEAPKMLTPPVYADAKTTPLKATIASGKNTVPLDLKSQ